MSECQEVESPRPEEVAEEAPINLALHSVDEGEEPIITPHTEHETLAPTAQSTLCQLREEKKKLLEEKTRLRSDLQNLLEPSTPLELPVVPSTSRKLSISSTSSTSSSSSTSTYSSTSSTSSSSSSTSSSSSADKKRKKKKKRKSSAKKTKKNLTRKRMTTPQQVVNRYKKILQTYHKVQCASEALRRHGVDSTSFKLTSIIAEVILVAKRLQIHPPPCASDWTLQKYCNELQKFLESNHTLRKEIDHLKENQQLVPLKNKFRV